MATRQSQGYSGSDIAHVITHANQHPVDRLMKATHFMKIKNQFQPCAPDTNGAMKLNWDQVSPNSILVPRLEVTDVLAAMEVVRPTTGPEDMARINTFKVRDISV